MGDVYMVNGKILSGLPNHAKDIEFDNTGTTLSSTNTEDAIKEVNSNLTWTHFGTVTGGTAFDISTLYLNANEILIVPHPSSADFTTTTPIHLVKEYWQLTPAFVCTVGSYNTIPGNTVSFRVVFRPTLGNIELTNAYYGTTALTASDCKMEVYYK